MIILSCVFSLGASSGTVAQSVPESYREKVYDMMILIKPERKFS